MSFASFRRLSSTNFTATPANRAVAAGVWSPLCLAVTAAIVSLACNVSPALAQQGRVIAIGDEWMLSDAAFNRNAGATQSLATSLSGYFRRGSVPGNFLVVSSSASFPGIDGVRGVLSPQLASFMTSLGNTWTVNPVGFEFTANQLSAFDAVFLSGTVGSGASNADVLADFVHGGGSVLVMAGTGDFGSAGAEAQAWNPFLNQFGLALESSWFGLGTGPGNSRLVDVPVTPVGNDLAIASSSVLWSFGHRVVDTTPSEQTSQIALNGDFSQIANPPTSGPINAQSIIGTFNIPSPGSVVLFAGIGVLSAFRRR